MDIAEVFHGSADAVTTFLPPLIGAHGLPQLFPRLARPPGEGPSMFVVSQGFLYRLIEMNSHMDEIDIVALLLLPTESEVVQ